MSAQDWAWAASPTSINPAHPVLGGPNDGAPTSIPTMLSSPGSQFGSPHPATLRGPSCAEAESSKPSAPQSRCLGL